MKYSLLLAFSFIGLLASAQLKQKIADEHYKNFEYSKCVLMFDELAKKCTNDKKSCDWENVRKAAFCHYNLFEMEKANHYFSILQKQNALTETDRVTYIKSLRYTQKYDESTNLIKESAANHPQNSYFTTMNSDKNSFKALFADTGYYEVQELSINSDKGDFAPAYFNQSIVYASKSKNTGFLNPTYGWDDDYYLNILQSNIVNDSVLETPKLLKNNFISRAHDGPVSFNSDGTEMVITKNTLGRKKGKEVIVLSLYFSKLVNGEWTELVPFEHNNEAYNVGHAVYADNDQTLYFVSDNPKGVGGSDIYVSKKTGNSWTKPEILGSNVNTTQDEMFPFVNGKTLYFTSNGHFGLGGLDIFEINLPDGKLRNLGAPVNSSADDFTFICDSTGLNGYFSSNRLSNVDHIYSFVKEEVLIDLIVRVFEKYDVNEIVPTQPIILKNEVTGEKKNIFLTKMEIFTFK